MTNILTVAGVSISLLLTLGCRVADQERVDNPQQSLSVEETLGLVFTTFIDSPSTHLYKHANPEARPALRKILRNKALSQYHENVWLALGYIGDASDVERLEKSLEQDFSGVLMGFEGNTVQMMFGALGLMVSRPPQSGASQQQ